jgi:hypothetical protein
MMSLKKTLEKFLRGWLPKDPIMPANRLSNMRRPLAVLITASLLVASASILYALTLTTSQLPPALPEPAPTATPTPQATPNAMGSPSQTGAPSATPNTPQTPKPTASPSPHTGTAFPTSNPATLPQLTPTQTPQPITFNSTYGGNDQDVPHAVVQTSNGGYALAGETESFGAGGKDAWLVKTDAQGRMEWNKTYGGNSTDWATALVTTQDGGYAMLGGTWSYDPGTVWLIKTDAYGNMEWNKTYGTERGEQPASLLAAADGGYLMAGYTNSPSAEFVWLRKTDAAGNIQWNRTYGGIINSTYVRQIVATPDGGYAALGYTWILKTDTYGNKQWNQTYPLDAPTQSFAVAPNGGFALTGIKITHTGPIITFTDGTVEAVKPAINETSSTTYELWLGKTDAAGNLLWNRTYLMNESQALGGASYVTATADGGYALATSTSAVDPMGDIWLLKTDAAGNVEWSKTYGAKAISNLAQALIQTSDGGYAVAGSFADYTQLIGRDFWLVKTDSNGNTK